MANRITDVYPFSGQCAFNVDFQHKEFRVSWTGSWLQPPSVAEFPSSAEKFGATIEQIHHSPVVDSIWLRSQAISHGANSHIRLLNDSKDPFPICKVAINERQRQMIGEEFAILQLLAKRAPNARIVRTPPEALQDEHGIFGFRMPKLNPITNEELAGYYHDILEVLHQVHDAGVIHYDLSWTNVMLNHNGHVTLIDFGHAGLSEEDIPPHKKRNKSHVKYSVSHDFDTLQDLRRYESPKVPLTNDCDTLTQHRKSEEESLHLSRYRPLNSH